MKKLYRLLFILLVILGGLYLLLPPALNPVKKGQLVLQPAAKSNYQTVQTKLAGKKNYPLYRNVDQNGGLGKIGSTKDFHQGLLQSLESAETKKGRFWLLNVNGRQVGWVKQKFFVRNKIALCQHISLVRNPNYRFPVKDAISYIAGKSGSLINPEQAHISPARISTANAGAFAVTVHYHHLYAKAIIHVRPNLSEGVTVANRVPAPGPKPVKTFIGSSRSSSPHWNWHDDYQPETKKQSYCGNHHGRLVTHLAQPRFHLLNSQEENSQLSQVGVIPEGIALKEKQLTVSCFSRPNSARGHLVTYDLAFLRDPLAVQNLLTMPWPSFRKYCRHLAVSPCLKLGHGQSLGMTKHYLYILVSNHRLNNSPQSEEIMQIKRDNYQIQHLWTLKVWNRSAFYPRYFHNAMIINGHTIYAAFHNAFKNCYEYWRLTRHGNSWQAAELAATQGNFVKNAAPAQAFAYARQHFYLAFNDNLFVIRQNGSLQRHYRFHTLREMEGCACQQKKLYLELARRPELFQLKP